MAASASVQPSGQYLITDYGAVGNGKFDNAPIINGIISRLPAAGGTIRIPIGEFVIDSPLLITSCNVTIQGVNRGWRSNVDLPVPGLTGLGGGSKLILGPQAECAIEVPIRQRMPDGQANRVTGIAIRDLNICGAGSSAGQTGVDIDQDGDGLVIDNISCINLGQGLLIKSADATRISDCLIAECRTCVSVLYSIQTMLTNCDFGGQPRGVSCLYSGDNQLLMTGCDVFPDGACGIEIRQSQYCTVSNCLISGWYTGLIDVQGDHNTLLGDSISAIDQGQRGWPPDPLGRDGSYGLIRISGVGNSFQASSIVSSQPTNDVRVHCAAGQATRLSDLNISGTGSTRKVVVDDDSLGTVILNCAEANEMSIPRDVPVTVEAIPLPAVAS